MAASEALISEMMDAWWCSILLELVIAFEKSLM